jgi:hypothetical protein
MQRRGFLKCLFAVPAAGLIAVPALRLIEPEELVLDTELWGGTARELVQFDIFRNAVILRIDVMSDKMHGGVDQILTPGAGIESLYEARKRAALMIGNEMKMRGVMPSDLKPMPIPAGYKKPDYSFLLRASA